ncbi:hypothetical protein [Agromyces humatus]|uniref:Small secreted hydrophilic protein n=1 Tax=Agromyces humatus TaxID=279573 RepID=A0ABN2KX68_9MICO|nr:hypothetical protein [Agromyces humatus]
MEEPGRERLSRRRPAWLVAGVVGALVVLGILGVSNALAVADSRGTQQQIAPVVGGTPTPSPSAPPVDPAPSPDPAPVPAPPPVDIDDDDDDDADDLDD